MNFSSIEECAEFDRITNHLVKLLAEGAALPDARGEKESDTIEKRRSKSDKSEKEHSSEKGEKGEKSSDKTTSDRSSTKEKETSSSSSGTEEKRKKKDKEKSGADESHHSKSARPSVAPALPPDEPVNKHLAHLQMPSKKGGSLPLMKQRSESALLDGASGDAGSGDESPTPADAISLATYTGELSLRDQIVRELFTSECKYVEGLMMLQHQVRPTRVRVFRSSHTESRCRPCRYRVAQYVSEGKSVFSEDEARVVFGNVALLTNYNKALLKDLRARIQVTLGFVVVARSFDTAQRCARSIGVA